MSVLRLQPGPGATRTEDLRAILAELTRIFSADDADRIDQLDLLESIKGAAAGAQAAVTQAFAASQRARQEELRDSARAAGDLPPTRGRIGVGIAQQVALARRESPTQGARHLALAEALEEMPHTRCALTLGEITEWRATVLVRETACLSRADRATVDAELGSRPGGLRRLGDRETEHEARKVAYRLDPHAATRRAARATAERRVSVRPAPDTMAHLSALLTARDGIAVHADLGRCADMLRASGDPRSRGQIMADTLVERVTGRPSAASGATVHAPTASAEPTSGRPRPGEPAPGGDRHGVGLALQLVMTDGTFLGSDDTAAHLQGYGPVPAPLARAWLGDEGTDSWLRRLFARPGEGQLVAMESSQRTFDGALRHLIGIRDLGSCRTPWCDAPLRHVDHPVRVADGGSTTARNSQGLCAACNQAKEAPGWDARPVPGTTGDDRAGSTIRTTTPTGHVHDSPVPRSVAAAPPPPLAIPRSDDGGPPLPPGTSYEVSYTLISA